MKENKIKKDERFEADRLEEEKKRRNKARRFLLFMGSVAMMRQANEHICPVND